VYFTSSLTTGEVSIAGSLAMEFRFLIGARLKRVGSLGGP